MMLPEAAVKPDAAWLEDLPEETLEAMLEAGREVVEWRRILTKTGDNIVGEVLKQEGQGRHGKSRSSNALQRSARTAASSSSPSASIRSSPSAA
jgi:hypothetical protein